MKKLLNLDIVVLLIIVVIFILPLAACTETDISEVASAMGISSINEEMAAAELGSVNAFVIVVQATQNSIDPDLYLRLENIADAIYSWSTAGSTCAIISVSGSPRIVETYSVPKSDAVTMQQVKDDQAFWGTKIINLVSEVTADTVEVDTLGAITKAGNWLLDQMADNKYILFIGSGIATENEFFTFTNPNLISAEPSSVAIGLSERNALTDLSGVTVIFGGLGCTEQPQSPIGAATKFKLTALYESLITQAGGDFKQVYTELGGNSANSQYSVTTVDFHEKIPLSFNEPVSFSQDEIRFIGDSAEYIDPIAVTETLKPYAQQIIDNNLNIILAGFVAGNGTTGFSYTLSIGRARAVSSSLISLGVDSSQITVVGLGGGGENWHTPDTNSSGSLIEEYAKLNRRVVMVMQGSDEAAELLGLAESISRQNEEN